MKHNNRHPFLDSTGTEKQIAQEGSTIGNVVQLIASFIIQKATETVPFLTNLTMWYTLPLFDEN